MSEQSDWLNEVQFDDQGLIPAIAQDHKSKEVLMFAWMNAEALQLSIKEQRAIYWSRSRQKLWRKGEESGHEQHLKSIYIDCDADVILMEVDQVGGIACHTGRVSCFFREFKDGDWKAVADVVKDPEEIYK